MKKLLVSAIAVFSTVLMIGCGKDGGGGGTTTVVNPGVTPVCNPGQAWNGYSCVLVNGGGNNITTKVSFADGSVAFAAGGHQLPGNLRITNTAAYAAFLKDAFAICDREGLWLLQVGLANCANWTSGYLFLDITIDPSLVPKVALTAYPAPSWYNYTLSVGISPGGIAANPLYLNRNNRFSIIPNKQGVHSKAFEIRAGGAEGTPAGLFLIQIQAHEGTLADAQVKYDLAYKFGNQNVVFATGTLQRYQ